MARNIDFPWVQGETYRRGFLCAVPGADVDDPNVPMDFSGCSARMQVREKYGTEVLLELTTENGGIEFTGEPGVLWLYVSAEQTDELGVTADPLKPRKRAKHDLEVVYPNGDVKRIWQGDVSLDPNITRDEP